MASPIIRSKWFGWHWVGPKAVPYVAATKAQPSKAQPTKKATTKS